MRFTCFYNTQGVSIILETQGVQIKLLTKLGIIVLVRRRIFNMESMVAFHFGIPAIQTTLYFKIM